MNIAITQVIETRGFNINFSSAGTIVTAMMNDAADGVMDGMMGNTQIMMDGRGGMMGKNPPLETGAGTSGLASAMTAFMGSSMNKSGLTVAEMQALHDRISADNGLIQ